MNSAPVVFDTAAVARRLHTTIWQLYKKMASGLLQPPSMVHGRQYVWTAEDVERAAAALKVPNRAGRPRKAVSRA
jgi:hypothetical protein